MYWSLQVDSDLFELLEKLIEDLRISPNISDMEGLSALHHAATSLDLFE